MSWFKPHDLLDRTFQVGIILKGLDGIVETLGGVFLLAISPRQIDRLAAWITRHDLAGDPHGYVAVHLERYAHNLTSASVTFGAVYLLVHGLAKIVLVVALLRGKRWAYPWLIGVLLAFVVYQLYRIAIVPSGGLIFLTVFDLVIVWLTWREWRRLPPRAPAVRQAA